MSKERARRRALAEVERAKRAARRERAEHRRATLRRMVPHLQRRRTGKLFARRSRAQRAAIASGVLVALILVWWLVDPLLTRIALTALVAVATPTLVVLTLDRRI
jgi:Flp pilus assembly protein TadB